MRISKPNLVDLLRLCDRNHWCSPRIRYASIRSKPDLCRDLILFFTFKLESHLILISPNKQIRNFPEIYYNLKIRRFFLNDREFDCAKVSRSKPLFQMKRGPITLKFGPLYSNTHDNGRVAAFFLTSS